MGGSSTLGKPAPSPTLARVLRTQGRVNRFEPLRIEGPGFAGEWSLARRPLPLREGVGVKGKKQRNESTKL